MGSLSFLLFVSLQLLSFHGALAQSNGYPSPGLSLGKPSVAIIIGIFSLVFAFTALLFVCAKFCQMRRTHYSFDVWPEGRAQFPPGFLLEEEPRFSGADKELIEMLPSFKFSELKGSRDGLECAVCLARFDDAERLRLLPKCKHAFHVGCIDRWLEAHSSCPLCRQRVSMEDVTRFKASSSSRFLFGSGGDPGLDLIVERETSAEQEMMHRFKHRIIVSDVVFKNRWSDLNAADLVSLNSEMLSVVSSGRFGGETGSRERIGGEMGKKILLDKKAGMMNFGSSAINGGASSSNTENIEASSSRNNRVMSEIVRVPRFREGMGRRADTAAAIWLPMAKRTVQWFARKEKKGSDNQEIGRTGLNV